MGMAASQARFLGLTARKNNVEYVYVSTNHIGLYEKGGYEFFKYMKDIEGSDSRVYRKKL